MDWELNSSKIVGSLQNLSMQIARQEGHRIVMPMDVMNAIKIFMNTVDNAGSGLIVPSGLKVNSVYERRG